MDVIFDIDGTLADAQHRLHFITEPASWIGPFKRDWDKFLAPENVIKDAPIRPILEVMSALDSHGNRLLLMTGRKESLRVATVDWLNEHARWFQYNGHRLYMRADSDRRPSHETKQDNLMQARSQGFNPVLVFEDRADDTAMWRRNGLICCQVAEGAY